MVLVGKLSLSSSHYNRDLYAWVPREESVQDARTLERDRKRRYRERLKAKHAALEERLALQKKPEVLPADIEIVTEIIR